MDPLYQVLPLVLITSMIWGSLTHAIGYSKGKRFGFRQGVDIQKHNPELAAGMISERGQYR